MFKASDVRTQQVEGSRVVAIATKDRWVVVLTENGNTSQCTRDGWNVWEGEPADPTVWIARFSAMGYDTLRR